MVNNPKTRMTANDQATDHDPSLNQNSIVIQSRDFISLIPIRSGFPAQSLKNTDGTSLVPRRGI
jgi:hypothetical protein